MATHRLVTNGIQWQAALSSEPGNIRWTNSLVQNRLTQCGYDERKRKWSCGDDFQEESIDLLCAGDTRGGSARMICGKNSKYKFFCSGDESGGGEGLLLNESLVENVISVERIDRCLMYIRIMIGKMIVRVFSVYAPQAGRPEHEKDSFYTWTNGIHPRWRIHTGMWWPEWTCRQRFQCLMVYMGYMSWFWFQKCWRHPKTLDFCSAADLAITNTFFTKEEDW